MPGDNGFGSDDEQNAAPGGPQPAKENPEDPIVEPESGPTVLSLEHTELLTKGKDLKAQVVAGAEEDAEAADHADEEGDLGTRCIPWGDPGVRVSCLPMARY